MQKLLQDKLPKRYHAKVHLKQLEVLLPLSIAYDVLRKIDQKFSAVDLLQAT